VSGVAGVAAGCEQLDWARADVYSRQAVVRVWCLCMHVYARRRRGALTAYGDTVQVHTGDPLGAQPVRRHALADD